MPLIVRGSGFAKLLASSGGITYPGGDKLIDKTGNTWCATSTMLTDNIAVIAYSDFVAGNIYVMVVDMSKPGKLYCGKPTLIVAGNNMAPKEERAYATEIVRLNDETALIAYTVRNTQSGYNDSIYYTLLSINQLNIYSEESGKLFSNIAPTYYQTVVGLVNLEDNKILATGGTTNSRLCARVITLSNQTLTLTLGVQTQLNTQKNSGNEPRVSKLSSTSAIITSHPFAIAGKETTHIYHTIVAINGNEISVTSKKNYEVNAKAAFYIKPETLPLVGLSESTFLAMIYDNNTSKFMVGLYSITSNNALSEFEMPARYYSSSDTLSYIEALKISDSKIYLLYLDSTGKLVYLPINYTASSITKGNPIELTHSMLINSKTVNGTKYDAIRRFGVIKSTNFPLMTFWPNDNLQLMCHGEKA